MNNEAGEQTLRAMALLRTWAEEDPGRRYLIEWKGAVTQVGSTGWRGGWQVACWSIRYPKRKLVHHLGGALLMRAVNKALERYRIPTDA